MTVAGVKHQIGCFGPFKNIGVGRGGGGGGGGGGPGGGGGGGGSPPPQ